MFGLELGIGGILALLVNAVGLGYYIIRIEQQSKTNSSKIEELQKAVDKLFVDQVAFKLDASQRFVTQENLNKIEDKITYEIRRLGDKLDKMNDHYNTKSSKDT